VGGVKICVIGAMSPNAPSLVAPGNFGSMTIGDPATYAMKELKIAQEQGADIYVANVHLGVSSFDPVTGAPKGELIDFANGVSGFDVILGDGTGLMYNGTINGALVTENRSRGLGYVKINVVLRGGKVTSKTPTFVVPSVTDAIGKDAAIESFLVPYRQQLLALYDTVINTATATFIQGNNITLGQETALGDLCADSMRHAYNVTFALINGGGIGSSLPSSFAPQNKSLRRQLPGYAPGPPFDIVKGDPVTVLPFADIIVTRNITGTQLWQALENGVSLTSVSSGTNPTCIGTAGRFPQISGLKFTFKCVGAAGTRIQAVAFPNGTAIPNDTTSYSFATYYYVITGGDGYTMFSDNVGSERNIAYNVLSDYIHGPPALTPTTDGRIVGLTN